MNRIEYMTKLASLLQDIPEVERKDAMKYYNDYFDEAGEENEEQVIREFGAPEEVAENIKSRFKRQDRKYNAWSAGRISVSRTAISDESSGE